MRKLEIFIIIIIIGFLLALWSPWSNWNIPVSQLFGIEPTPEIGGLQITSLSGELELYIDNHSEGTVDPSSSPLIIPAIDPGKHKIRLVRISIMEEAYAEFNKLVVFESGVDVVITYELGPTSKFSEGHVIYATINSDTSDVTFLNISSSPEGATIFINGVTAGTTPLVLYPISLNEQHLVKLSLDGSDSQEFTLLPESQTEREKLKGFTLNVEANLFLQPIRVRDGAAI